MFTSKDGTWSFHNLVKGSLLQTASAPDATPI